MQRFLDYLYKNKEWIFSGIGVAMLTMLIAIFRKRITSSKVIQKQRSGDNSVNTQIGRDLNSNKSQDDQK